MLVVENAYLLLLLQYLKLKEPDSSATPFIRLKRECGAHQCRAFIANAHTLF
jgi:hypothetical protein